ncbi:MAG TPA: hypothetical protein VH105_20640, partial [Burkholderiales bacterium]|nr:hypothetical protein [Burkholderiales bacterium]
RDLRETDERGRPVQDDTFLVLFNAHHDAIEFSLPSFDGSNAWMRQIDTSYEDGGAPYQHHAAGSTYPLQGRSLVVLLQGGEML